MSEWYEVAVPTTAIWWWAVEHRGHPAFYMRTLMAGDLAPGRLPLPRHVRALDGNEDAAVVCGTCEESPAAADLEVIERQTGLRDFLKEYRSGRVRWPKPTDPATCWSCSMRRVPADRVIDGHNVCAQCEAHLLKRR